MTVITLVCAGSCSPMLRTICYPSHNADYIGDAVFKTVVFVGCWHLKYTWFLCHFHMFTIYLVLNTVKRNGEDGGGGHWLVWMEWCPAGWPVCLPLLIFPCTIGLKSRSLAPAHPGGPGKRAIKRLWCGSAKYFAICKGKSFGKIDKIYCIKSIKHSCMVSLSPINILLSG